MLTLKASKSARRPKNNVIPLWGRFQLRDGMPRSKLLWEYEVGGNTEGQ